VPARRMRVELFDNEGNRYTIAFEGQITRDKALRLLDLIELLGGASENEFSASLETHSQKLPSSRFDKVRLVIQKSFPLIWFSSKEVQSAYEQELKEPISLSTVSTYLARMAIKGLLVRAGEANNLKYKLVTNVAQRTINQQIRTSTTV